MLYTNFIVKENEYKLRLTTQFLIQVEEKLGGNAISIFMQAVNGTLPATKDLIIILHGAMQKYHANIKLTDVYDIYDNYVEEGHNLTDLMLVIVEVLQNSGVIPKPEKTEERTVETNSKN